MREPLVLGVGPHEISKADLLGYMCKASYLKSMEVAPGFRAVIK